MRVYDVYGISCESLEAAKTRINVAIGIELIRHDSAYHCGDYYRYKDAGEEHFIVQRNFDSVEDEWTEPERTDKPFLLYVNETPRSDELRRILEAVNGVELLKHEEVPAGSGTRRRL